MEHESEVPLERIFPQNPAPESNNLIQPAWKTVVELRSRRGWTQEKLAEKSILSVRTIQNLERGKAIHLGTITKVAGALGVSPDDCIAGTRAAGNAAANGHAIPPCPYRGLLAFREEDADVFFGREALIHILKEKLDRKNIIQVSGCSGSGKSSLVAAGLVPALKSSDSWKVVLSPAGSRSVRRACLRIDAPPRA